MIIKNAKIFTNSEKGFIENGWIKIVGDEIQAIGSGEIPDDKEIIDAKGMLITPGFVNAHTHIYSALARGIPLSISPRNFYEILRDLWWKLDKVLDEESIYYSAFVGGIESLKSGVTTLFDHHASYGYIEGSLSILKNVLVDSLGMRADLCYEISDRWGPDEKDKTLTESFNFVKNTKRSSYLSYHIGLHASFTLEGETLRYVKENTPEDIGFHIHVAEGIEDQVEDIKRYGKRTIEKLSGYNILRENSIVVHGIRLTEKEVDIIAERDSFFAHAPQSNMNNGVGIQDIEKLIDKRINVVLGNDGFGFNILNDLRVMMLSQKNEKRNFNALSFPKIERVFLENNYKLVERFFPGRFGKILPGYKADMVVFDYDPPTPMNEGNFLGHLIFGLSDRVKVDKVFIGGKLRVDNGKVIGIDEDEIYEKSRRATTLLWKRIGG